MSIVFVIDNLTAGNAYIRGILPSMGMKNEKINAKYCVANSFNPNSVSDGDTVVFVKYDRLGQSKAVKQNGAKVVLDVVDSKKHWMQHRDNLDALIVNTDSSRHIIKNIHNFNKPMFKIPHILTNFDKDYVGQKRKDLPLSPKTIGYLGVADTFTDDNSFIDFCSQNNLKWYQWQPTINSNEVSTLKIDLGCINFTHEKERIGGTYTITKPSAKLLNMFSYGIPALFSPYESYIDAITAHNYTELLWCVCGSKYAMLDKIKILKNDKSLYAHLSNLSFELSKNFHISNTCNIYKELLEFAGIKK